MASQVAAVVRVVRVALAAFDIQSDIAREIFLSLALNHFPLYM